MGNVFARRKIYKWCIGVLSNQRQKWEKTMGDVFARRKIYKWSIEGYSSIEKNVKDRYASGCFEAEGYRWKLIFFPNYERGSDGKRFIRLHLYLDISSLPSNLVLKVDYKVWLYDQLNGKHICRGGNNYFSTTKCYQELYMISMEKFESSSYGFLVNDGCFLGAEVRNIVPIMVHNDASESSSVQKKMVSYSSTWVINNFSKIQKPTCSKDFEAGGFTWHLKLCKYDNFIALFLELDTSTLPPNSGINAEFTFCMVDQVKGNHKKLKAHHDQFCSKAPNRGWSEFLQHEDLQNPSNGFLVDDTCIVKASVTVLGSSSYHNF